MATGGSQTRGWVVGRILGARVVVQWSSLVMVGILAVIWGQDGNGQYTNRSLATGLEFAGVVFLSVFLHEVAHAFAGRAFGREVKEIVLTLMGAHTSFDGRNLTATASGVIAAAGPLMNGILAASAHVILMTTNPSISIGILLYSIYLANLWLAVFNILPGIPMDGGRVLEAVVWGISKRPRWGTIAAAWGGRVVAIGFLAYIFWINTGAGRTPSMFSLVWGFLLFGVMWPPSSEALRAARIQGRVDAVNVTHLMHPAIGVRFDVSVAAAVREAEKAGADEVVVLTAEGHAAGHFALATALSVPEDRRISTYLDAVTVPIPRGAEIPATLGGREALGIIREWWGKTDAMAAMDEGEAVGVVILSEVGQRLK